MKMIDSTSLIKGTLLLAHANTPGTKWLRWNVTAVASPAGYRNITAVVAGSSAGGPSPRVNTASKLRAVWRD